MKSFNPNLRRKFIKQAAFLAPALLAAAPLAADDRPNIVFFMTDDQSPGTVGSYGNPIVETPQLDRLAETGVRFDRAFVSQPICWASRTSILTGLTTRSYGMPDEPDHARPETVETLVSDRLREAGYRTGFYGKWHSKMPPGYQPREHFDEFEPIGRNPYFKRLPDGSLRHETDLIVDRGIAFVKNQPAGQPFALNLWFNATHAEDSDRRPGHHFAWPPSAADLYRDIEMPRPRLDDPDIFAALPPFLRTSITRERYFWRWNTPEKYDANIRAYVRQVSGIDHAIGRFREALEAAGLADNTIIVYSADNGFHMGNRGLAGKWSHYEESIHVPLIIYDPRLPAEVRGRATDAPALNLDFPSTFLDWAGAEIPDSYEGRSLVPVLTGDTPDDWRESTLHEYFAVRNMIPAWEGLREQRFKYARYFDHDHEFLHDLENDPDELVNLALNPEYAKTLQRLRTVLDARVEALGGPIKPMSGNFRASTPPHPEAAAAVTIKPGQDGWGRLFNGENLNGWDGEPGFWSVEDCAITGVTDGSLQRNHFLSWKGSTIHNFELQVKVRISEGGNSGIQYRSTPELEMGDTVELDSVSGYQCTILADWPEYNGMLYEERGRGILARTGEKVVVDPEGRSRIVDRMPVKKFAAGEWHDYRVRVEGNHHRHWIDGHPTVDLIDLDESGRATGGVLAVQLPSGPLMKVQFKDFRIRHLPDDLPLMTPDEVDIPNDAVGIRVKNVHGVHSGLWYKPDNYQPDANQENAQATPRSNG